MDKPIKTVWLFGSDSNPSKQYQTLLYMDGSTSCNCPGWTRRVAADGSRSCKHTRLVDMNAADDACVSRKSYVAAPQRSKVIPVETNPVRGRAFDFAA